MALNDQERRFAQELVSGCSIAEAARRAGYAESVAKSDATLWLQPSHTKYKPELYAHVDELRGKMQNDKIASREEVLAYWTKILRTNINEICEYDGYALKPKSFKDMGDAISIVDGMEWSKGQYAKAFYAKKMEASKEIAKFHGLAAPKKHEITGDIKTNSFDISNLTDSQLEALIEIKKQIES